MSAERDRSVNPSGERNRGVNREAYYQIWGEPPPGEPAVAVEPAPAAPRPVPAEAPRPRESKDSALAKLSNDLEFLSRRIDSVFSSLKTSLDQVEQAQLSQRDEIRALSRRLGVSMERRRAAEASRKRSSSTRQRPQAPSASEPARPQSFFGVSSPRGTVNPGRSMALGLGAAIGAVVMLITALAGVGSPQTTGFVIAWVNIVLGFGVGLLSVGILLRQSARRRPKRRPN